MVITKLLRMNSNYWQPRPARLLALGLRPPGAMLSSALAAALVLAMPCLAADKMSISTAPISQGRPDAKALYVGNRSPLAPSPFLKLPIGSFRNGLGASGERLPTYRALASGRPCEMGAVLMDILSAARHGIASTNAAARAEDSIAPGGRRPSASNRAGRGCQ